MRNIEFRVFDFFNKKVLYGEQIPKFGGGILESIRQLSGQNYELSQYTENHDIDGKRIYEKDIVEILGISTKKEFQFEYTKKGQGFVEYSSGIPSVKFLVDGEINILSLHDGKHDYRVIGNKIDAPN